MVTLCRDRAALAEHRSIWIITVLNDAVRPVRCTRIFPAKFAFPFPTLNMGPSKQTQPGSSPIADWLNGFLVSKNVRIARRIRITSSIDLDAGVTNNPAPTCILLQGEVAEFCLSDVRFTPNSGHVQCNQGCPLCANSVHWRLFNHLVGYRRRHMANNSNTGSNLPNVFMVKQLRLSAPA